MGELKCKEKKRSSRGEELDKERRQLGEGKGGQKQGSVIWQTRGLPSNSNHKGDALGKEKISGKKNKGVPRDRRKGKRSRKSR